MTNETQDTAHHGEDAKRPVERMSKVDYVRSRGQDRRHTCHWPGCEQQVPPAMWGCKPHWFRLPPYLRNLIWSTYEPGQEQRMDPSDEYLEAAQRVQNWIEAATNGGRADG